MRGARRRAGRLAPAALALALSAALAISAAALAAKPKRGAHFAGKTAALPINGFPAPVQFTVSADGKSLTGVRYSSLGCFGAGGFVPGIDFYTKPFAVHKVGSVKVAASGRFSVSRAVSSYTIAGRTTKTTTSVTGKFTKATAAIGRITFSQTEEFGGMNAACGPATVTFSARAH